MSNDFLDPSPSPHRQFQRPRFFPVTDESVPKPTEIIPVVDTTRDTTRTAGNFTRRQLAGHDTGNGPAFAAQSGMETPPQVFGIVAPPPMQNGIRTPSPTFNSWQQGAAPQLVLSDEERLARRNREWQPGTSGFSDARTSPSAYSMSDTFPMMVLRGIAQKQGEQQPAMQSELSGAASGAAIVGLGNVSGTVLKYIGNFIIQRGFGPGIFGLYSLGLSLVTLVSSIFNLGLDDAMLRYIPIYRSKKNPSALRSLVIFCTALAGITGIFGAILLLIFAPQLVAFRHTPKDAPLLTTTFELMAPMIPLLCMQGIWFGGLQGFKAFKFRVLSQRLVPTIALIMLLGLAFLFSHHIKAIIIATVMSTVIGTVLSLYYLFRLVSRLGKQKSKTYEVREWLGFATPNFLTTITDTVMESTDTLLLAFFAISSVGLGQYAAAIKYSNFIALPLVSLNTMFAPTIAELHSQGEFKKLEAMFKVVTRWTVILSLPIFGVCTIFAAPLLAVSGAGFVAAWPLLIAFSVGGLINAGTGCVGYMLLMTGHQKLSFINSVAGIIVNVVLGVILTPRYGAMGTAISTGLAVVAMNLTRLIQVRLILKIQPYNWNMLKPLAAGLIAALISGVCLYPLIHLHIPLFLCLGLVPVFLAIYIAIVALFRLGPEDQVVVDRLRKKLLRRKKK
ncbi:MAG: flippase [Ktedonobacteraceae bacterium]